MRYVDANVIVDALIDQGTLTHVRSEALLEALARGEITLATTELALNETLWVLRSNRAGRMSRADAAQAVRKVLVHDHLIVPNKRRWDRALEILTSYSVDVPDAYIAASMGLDDEVYSLDTDFDRIPGVRRVEP